MTKDNPFDLSEVAKEYDWSDAKDMRIVINVKSARGGTDCYNQLYCWMRDHFVKITKLEMLGGKEDEIKQLHEEFQDMWHKVIHYEDVLKTKEVGGKADVK